MSYYIICIIYHRNIFLYFFFKYRCIFDIYIIYMIYLTCFIWNRNRWFYIFIYSFYFFKISIFINFSINSSYLNNIWLSFKDKSFLFINQVVSVSNTKIFIKKILKNNFFLKYSFLFNFFKFLFFNFC